MSNFEADYVVTSGAHSLDQFREMINGYLDHIEAEHGEEVCFLLGGFVGSATFAGETGTFPNSHRMSGNLGYASGLFNEEEYDGEYGVPIGHAFEESDLNAIVGSVAFPVRMLSEEAREAVESGEGIKMPINPEVEEDNDGD